MFNIISWIVFGGITGWIASLITGTDRQYGTIATIVIGIIGAFLGGFVSRHLIDTGISGFNAPSLIISIFGAMLLIFIITIARGGGSRNHI